MQISLKSAQNQWLGGPSGPTLNPRLGSFNCCDDIVHSSMEVNPWEFLDFGDSSKRSGVYFRWICWNIVYPKIKKKINTYSQNMCLPQMGGGRRGSKVTERGRWICWNIVYPKINRTRNTRSQNMCLPQVAGVGAKLRNGGRVLEGDTPSNQGVLHLGREGSSKAICCIHWVDSMEYCLSQNN